MSKHDGIIPSDQAEKLYSYPSLSGSSDTFLSGAGSFDHPHTEYGAKTGLPTGNVTPGWGGYSNISQVVTDKYGHVTALNTRRFYQKATTATQSAVGLMSANDKKKLDGIEDGAQVNSVTGVKGDSETDFRTGNVNITAANVGAAASNHTHTPSEIGAATSDHTHTAADVGAAASDHNHDSTYAKLAGSNFSGKVTVSGSMYLPTGQSIQLKTKNTFEPFITVPYTNTSGYGGDVIIGGKQAMVIGAGESPHTGYDNNLFTHDNETMYVVSDGSVVVKTNMNTITNTSVHRTFTFGSDGVLTVPTIAGSLNGNATSATSATTANSANTATALAAPCNIDGFITDGATNIHRYVRCTTPAATSAKTATVSNFDPSDGAIFVLWMGYNNTAEEYTFSINGSDPAPFYTQANNVFAANRLKRGLYLVCRTPSDHWMLVSMPPAAHHFRWFDGIQENGDDDESHYFYVGTSAATADKAASNSSTIKYANGTWAVLILAQNNSSDSPTLNLNSLGALPWCSANGVQLSGSELKAGSHFVVQFNNKWYDVGVNV